MFKTNDYKNQYKSDPKISKLINEFGKHIRRLELDIENKDNIGFDKYLQMCNFFDRLCFNFNETKDVKYLEYLKQMIKKIKNYDYKE